MTVINEIFQFKKHCGWTAIMGGEVFVLSQQGPWRSGLLDVCFNPRSLPVLCLCHIFQLYFVKSSTKERSHKLFLKTKWDLHIHKRSQRTVVGRNELSMWSQCFHSFIQKDRFYCLQSKHLNELCVNLTYIIFFYLHSSKYKKKIYQSDCGEPIYELWFSS